MGARNLVVGSTNYILISTSGVKTLYTHLVYDSWLLNFKLEIIQVLDVSCQQSEGLNRPVYLMTCECEESFSASGCEKFPCSRAANLP